ncbi:hypothetical protein DB88DRAFT_520451 [Papiliotrema laurentii]|uniref:Uncharacterized protein n=1 Tax=Papiliotrema laurentii TaxID=5418 RepID=A0AAD9CSL3_PAPLA|nr:hypothetical protein DB88DRAFT_520451 [Papiliotrema laurentii]
MVTYDLAQYSWNDTQSVTVVSSTAEVIAVFPLSFLLTGGCGNWSYVLETIGRLGSNREQCRGWRIDRRDGGKHIGPGSETTSGPSFLITGPVTRFARGPEYFRKNLPARAGDASSTRSDSKRSSVNQVYQAVLGISYPPPLFRPAAGLLLSDTLHHAFDRLELSFWYSVSFDSGRGGLGVELTSQNDVYYVHFFVAPAASDRRRWHGKALGPERFRGRPEDRPDPRFIDWHYKQCLMARIRGFSAGMAIPASSAEVINTCSG